MWQPPGGIDDRHVGALPARRGQRVVGHRPRVGVGRPLHELHAGALRPLFELLHPGGAKRVGGAEHDGAAELLAQMPGQLSDRGRLPGAVHAGDEDHRWLRAQVDVVIPGPRDVRQQLGQPLRERLAPADLAAGGLALQLLHHLRGRARADVGVDQRLLQTLPCFVAQVLEQRRLDLAG